MNLKNGCIAVVMFLSTGVQGQDTLSDVVATVNGEPIYRQSIELISSKLSAEGGLSEEAILNELVNLKLLSQAAEEAGLDRLFAIAAAVELQKEQTLANAYTSSLTDEMNISGEDLRAEYDRQVKRQEKTEFRVSHIQFDKEVDANAVLTLLDNNLDFAKLAESLSVSPDKDVGGDLGWFQYGKKSFEGSEEVEKLEINTTSQPIQTSFGWHIFKLTDTRGAVIPAFGDIKNEIQAIVVNSKLKILLDEMKDKAVVERITN